MIGLSKLVTMLPLICCTWYREKVLFYLPYYEFTLINDY